MRKIITLSWYMIPTHHICLPSTIVKFVRLSCLESDKIIHWRWMFCHPPSRWYGATTGTMMLFSWPRRLYVTHPCDIEDAWEREYTEILVLQRPVSNWSISLYEKEFLSFLHPNASPSYFLGLNKMWIDCSTHATPSHRHKNGPLLKLSPFLSSLWIPIKILRH